MIPDIETLYGVIDATWAPAAMTQAGPWTIREGQGGGQRVSAATANGPVTEADLPQAEAAMRALGQTPLFGIDEFLIVRVMAFVSKRTCAKFCQVVAW